MLFGSGGESHLAKAIKQTIESLLTQSVNLGKIDNNIANTIYQELLNYISQIESEISRNYPNGISTQELENNIRFIINDLYKKLVQTTMNQQNTTSIFSQPNISRFSNHITTNSSFGSSMNQTLSQGLFSSHKSSTSNRLYDVLNDDHLTSSLQPKPSKVINNITTNISSNINQRKISNHDDQEVITFKNKSRSAPKTFYKSSILSDDFEVLEPVQDSININNITHNLKIKEKSSIPLLDKFNITLNNISTNEFHYGNKVTNFTKIDMQYQQPVFINDLIKTTNYLKEILSMIKNDQYMDILTDDDQLRCRNRNIVKIIKVPLTIPVSKDFKDVMSTIENSDQLIDISFRTFPEDKYIVDFINYLLKYKYRTIQKKIKISIDELNDIGDLISYLKDNDQLSIIAEMIYDDLLDLVDNVEEVGNKYISTMNISMIFTNFIINLPQECVIVSPMKYIDYIINQILDKQLIVHVIDQDDVFYRYTKIYYNNETALLYINNEL